MLGMGDNPQGEPKQSAPTSFLPRREDLKFTCHYEEQSDVVIAFIYNLFFNLEKYSNIC